MQVDSSLKDLFSEISPEKFLEFLANLNINPLAVFATKIWWHGIEKLYYFTTTVYFLGKICEILSNQIW